MRRKDLVANNQFEEGSSSGVTADLAPTAKTNGQGLSASSGNSQAPPAIMQQLLLKRRRDASTAGKSSTQPPSTSTTTQPPMSPEPSLKRSHRIAARKSHPKDVPPDPAEILIAPKESTSLTSSSCQQEKRSLWVVKEKVTFLSPNSHQHPDFMGQEIWHCNFPGCGKIWTKFCDQQQHWIDAGHYREAAACKECHEVFKKPRNELFFTIQHRPGCLRAPKQKQK